MSYAYQIRIAGRLSADLLHTFTPDRADHDPTDTVFVRTMADDGELFGLIARCETLGLRLVSLQQIDPQRARRGVPSHLQLRLELVTVPISDIERAKAFYVDQVGFSVEQDVQVDDRHRFVELMPPGSPCSIALTSGYVASEPGSLKGIQVNVDNLDQVYALLRKHGVSVTGIQEHPWGRFCFFTDPDGNQWSVHEPPHPS